MANFHLVFWIVFLASSVNGDVQDSEDILHQLVWRMSRDIGELLADVKISIVSQEQQIQEQRQGFQQQLQQQQHGFQQQLQQQQQGFQQQLQQQQESKQQLQQQQQGFQQLIEQLAEMQQQQQGFQRQLQQQEQGIQRQLQQQQLQLDQLPPLIKFPKGCKTTTMGKEYTGTLATTKTGRICQRWDSQSPHKHSRTDASRYPDATLAEAANYCRNPTNISGGPWCYTTDTNKRWEYCDVPFCQ